MMQKILKYLTDYVKGYNYSPGLEYKTKSKSESTHHNLAILIVDMQPEYYLAFEKYEQKIILNSQLEVLQYAINRNIAIIRIEMEHETSTIYPLRKKLLESERVEIIQKNYQNAFKKTDLEKILKKESINELFVTGLFPKICAYLTALGAINAGFKVSTSPDVIGAISIDNGKINPESMSTYISSGITCYNSHKEFLEYLDTQTDHISDITPSK